MVGEAGARWLDGYERDETYAMYNRFLAGGKVLISMEDQLPGIDVVVVPFAANGGPNRQPQTRQPGVSPPTSSGSTGCAWGITDKRLLPMY